MKLRVLLVTVFLFSLTSCSFLLPTTSQKRIFILAHDIDNNCRNSDGTAVTVTEDSSGPQQYTNKIWFQRGAELGFYQFAEWSEPVADRIARIIRENVSCLSENKSDRIEFTILKFVHNAQDNPGEMLFSIRINGQRTFNYSQALKSYDVTGVVEASDAIVGQFLTDLKQFLS